MSLPDVDGKHISANLEVFLSYSLW